MLTYMTNTKTQRTSQMRLKVKIVRWDYPGGPQCNHIHACERGAEGDQTHRRGEGTVSTEGETGVMWSQAKLCQPPEARKGKEQGPAHTLISTQRT